MIRVVDEYDGEIESNAIIELTQSISGQNKNFTLGNTYCRSIDIKILKSAVENYPEERLFLFDDNDDPSSTLDDWTMYYPGYIDSVDDSDDEFYLFHLTDLMVKMNTPLEYEEGDTVNEILDRIKTKYETTIVAPTHIYRPDPDNPLYTENFFLQSLAINFADNITEREFLSYLAEINGCCVFIAPNGSIYFYEYLRRELLYPTIDANRCSDFTIGDHHHYDRVYAELGVGAISYPAESENDTLYLNPENIFLADYSSQGYSLEDIVEQIHSYINGLDFYNLTITRCDLNADYNLLTKFIYNNEEYFFLALYDTWEYNCGWKGGYRCEFTNEQQQETEIVSTSEKMKRLNIKIDRERGIIEQEIANVEEGLYSQITQTEEDISFVAGRLDELLELTLRITPEGVEIHQRESNSYTQFTSSGMYIYIGDSNVPVAWADKDGFSAQELIISDGNSLHANWHVHMSNDGKTLTFLRR